jgi:hypothetical protein
MDPQRDEVGSLAGFLSSRFRDAFFLQQLAIVQPPAREPFFTLSRLRARDRLGAIPGNFARYSFRSGVVFR